MLRLSTRTWSFIPEITGKWISPDVPVIYTSSDYFNNKDPWIDALNLYLLGIKN